MEFNLALSHLSRELANANNCPNFIKHSRLSMESIVSEYNKNVTAMFQDMFAAKKAHKVIKNYLLHNEVDSERKFSMQSNFAKAQKILISVNVE